jgi:hypothetical protein
MMTETNEELCTTAVARNSPGGGTGESFKHELEGPAAKQFETVFHVMHANQKDGNSGDDRLGVIIGNYKPGE